MVDQPHPDPVKFKPVTWREVEEGCARIAEEISAKGVKVDVIVGVLRGGWIPARLLSDYLGTPAMGALEVKFYRGIGETAERPVVTQPLIVDIRDKVVLVVDDVADTGKTLNIAINFLTHYGPRKIFTAALYLKPWSMHRPDFYAEETDAWIIFPWDKAETVEELVKKKGLSLETVSKITGEDIEFIKKIFNTRRMGTATTGDR
ncbi:phosphoribosyltransferase [Pyrodictium delaneyi]|uniref:Phosphoribosyltransferase n=1 Tax=Pyrodictium delaneyi TaxID=1273541 RepID=A0A0P0N1P1_9CREN|nr:phosphoribosyltransferase [Pyrodictium delaneyi]ALL00104.1 phosphoribosyltransferase [Pyrodictium delaneyi]OWJ55181.1 phosphoribosyltransferase [Pyrodictium delaneyi]